jgi:hypothetical protein
VVDWERGGAVCVERGPHLLVFGDVWVTKAVLQLKLVDELGVTTAAVWPWQRGGGHRTPPLSFHSGFSWARNTVAL